MGDFADFDVIVTVADQHGNEVQSKKVITLQNYYLTISFLLI